MYGRFGASKFGTADTVITLADFAVPCENKSAVIFLGISYSYKTLKILTALLFINLINHLSLNTYCLPTRSPTTYKATGMHGAFRVFV
ncbi:Uncharacterised protein [Rodentibacter pneumotropicus]|uniref:Uncharacterized protein n=1 Tax=Rodentibacter pneumotropicus TaxID=758 RepID=A0A3S4UAR3_9PAST|nr:Uncharacterised protein [Rodentibacter pneumotropicus]